MFPLFFSLVLSTILWPGVGGVCMCIKISGRSRRWIQGLTDWLTKEYIYRFGELFKWAKNITHKQHSTLSCISTSVFVPAFTDAWVRLLLVHVNLHFLTVLKTNETTWDTVTEKIKTKGKMKLLGNNLAFLHSVLHLNLLENKQFSWNNQQGHFIAVRLYIYCPINSEHVFIRWEEVQCSRYVLVHHIIKKTKQTEGFTALIVHVAPLAQNTQNNNNSNKKNPNGVQPVCIANDLPPLLLPSGLVGEEMWSINQPWGWFNWLSSSLCLVQKLLFTPAKSLIGWIEMLPESAGPTCDNTSSSALMEMFQLFGPCGTTKLTVGRNNSTWT